MANWKRYAALTSFVALALLLGNTDHTEAGRGDGPVVYVTGQGLCYDSILAAKSLPPRGPFQVLETEVVDSPSPDGLETEFGPGDQGYVGGRWVVKDDYGVPVAYFSCPLLGPGRSCD